MFVLFFHLSSVGGWVSERGPAFCALFSSVLFYFSLFSWRVFLLRACLYIYICVCVYSLLASLLNYRLFIEMGMVTKNCEDGDL